MFELLFIILLVVSCIRLMVIKTRAYRVIIIHKPVKVTAREQLKRDTKKALVAKQRASAEAWRAEQKAKAGR